MSIERLFKIIDNLNDPRKEFIKIFYRNYQQELSIAKGSKQKHQAWIGGYADHLVECCNIADALYGSLSTIRPLTFTLDSAKIVLLFHDIEKLFIYSAGLDPDFDKKKYLHQTLKIVWKIEFSDDEKNALNYVHGELDDYCSERKMDRLAAFIHSCDIISARMWFDMGQE
jgi:hypothetical protein